MCTTERQMPVINHFPAQNEGRLLRICPRNIQENDCKELHMSKLGIAAALSPPTNVSTDASSLGDSLDRIHMPMPESSSIGSSNVDRTEHQWKDMEAMIDMVCPMKDCKASNCTSLDKTLLLEDGTECNLLSCELAGGVVPGDKSTASFLHQEEFGVPASAEPCFISVIDGKKDENQFVCFQNKENDRACQRADGDDCMKSELILEGRDSCIKVKDVWKDGKIQVRAGVLMPVFAEGALNKVHIADKKDFVATTGLNAFSSDAFCKGEKVPCSYGANSMTLSQEPTINHQQDANHATASEIADPVSQRLLSEPVKKIKEEACGGFHEFATDGSMDSGKLICDRLDTNSPVGEDAFNDIAEISNSVFQAESMPESTGNMLSLAENECIATSANLTHDSMNGNVDSESGLHNIQDSNASQEEQAAENIGVSCDPLNCVSFAGATEFSETLEGYECKVSHENVSSKNRLPGIKEGLVLQERDVRGHLVSNGNVCMENAKNNALHNGEDCVSAATAKPCLLSTPYSVPQALVNEKGMAKAASSANFRNVKGTLFPQNGDGAATSSCQHRRCIIDENGHSKLEVAAAESKLQQNDEGTPMEDEERSGGLEEGNNRTPPCMEPSKQQRKKINIHHQFVREIVKIQHDREQYDREQAERQIQARQAANLLQAGRKYLENKEHKGVFPEKRDTGVETNKQKVLKDMAAHRYVKESHQKFSTKHEECSEILSRNEISQQRNASQDSHEQVQPGFPTVKDHNKSSRSKQHHPFSMYRPPISRVPSAVEHTKLGDPESVNKQPAADAMNNSCDRSVDRIFKSDVSIACSSHFENEKQSKGIRNNFGDCYTDSLKTEAEQSSCEMGIKVTFNTEKWQRHIQVSDGTGNSSKGELASHAVYCSSSCDEANKDFKSYPSLSNHFQASEIPLKSKQQIERREMSSKGNDDYDVHKAKSVNPPRTNQFQVSKFSSARVQEYGIQASEFTDHNFTPAARMGNMAIKHSLQDSKSSLTTRPIDHCETSKDNYNHSSEAVEGGFLQGFASAEHSRSYERVGKSSDKPKEKKNSFVELADTNENLYNVSSRLHRPPPFVQYGSDKQAMSNNGTIASEWSAGILSVSSQSLSNPNFQRTTATKPSFKEVSVGTPSVAKNMVGSEELKRSESNIQANFQHQQFNKSRFYDSRGNLTNNSTNNKSRHKQDSSHKRNTKEFSSPFQAMLKDESMPRSSLAMPAQRLADTNQDSRWFAMSCHAKDHAQTHESLQESLRASQPDASSSKTLSQNLQAQSSSPLQESVFCIVPRHEKWGDIAEDSTDSYDYLQFKSEDDRRESESGRSSYGGSNGNGTGLVDRRESESGRSSYGGSNGNGTGLVDTQLSTPIFRNLMQDRGLPQNISKDASSWQKHNDSASKHSYQTPRRKNVFERLGPQKNFQESILGPPPKTLDSKGVYKASPDALINSVQHARNFKNFNVGFYGSKCGAPSQLPRVQDGRADNRVEKQQEVFVQAYTEVKQRRSKRELYVPRRGS